MASTANEFQLPYCFEYQVTGVHTQSTKDQCPTCSNKLVVLQPLPAPKKTESRNNTDVPDETQYAELNHVLTRTEVDPHANAEEEELGKRSMEDVQKFSMKYSKALFNLLKQQKSKIHFIVDSSMGRIAINESKRLVTQHELAQLVIGMAIEQLNILAEEETKLNFQKKRENTSKIDDSEAIYKEAQQNFNVCKEELDQRFQANLAALAQIEQGLLEIENNLKALAPDNAEVQTLKNNQKKLLEKKQTIEKDQTIVLEDIQGIESELANQEVEYQERCEKLTFVGSVSSSFSIQLTNTGVNSIEITMDRNEFERHGINLANKFAKKSKLHTNKSALLSVLKSNYEQDQDEKKKGGCIIVFTDFTLQTESQSLDFLNATPDAESIPIHIFQLEHPHAGNLVNLQEIATRSNGSYTLLQFSK